MKKLADLTFILGSLAMLTALVLRAADMRQAAVIFLCGSILAAIGRLAAYRQPAAIHRLRSVDDVRPSRQRVDRLPVHCNYLRDLFSVQDIIYRET